MLLVHTACCGLGALLHGSPSRLLGIWAPWCIAANPNPSLPALEVIRLHSPLRVGTHWLLLPQLTGLWGYLQFGLLSFLGSIQDSPPGFLPHMAHVLSMAHTHIYPAF